MRLRLRLRLTLRQIVIVGNYILSIHLIDVFFICSCIFCMFSKLLATSARRLSAQSDSPPSDPTPVGSHFKTQNRISNLKRAARDVGVVLAELLHQAAKRTRRTGEFTSNFARLGHRSIGEPQGPRSGTGCEALFCYDTKLMKCSKAFSAFPNAQTPPLPLFWETWRRISRNPGKVPIISVTFSY